MDWIIDRLVPLGPEVTADEAAAAVASLRQAAAAAVPLVAEATGLPEADGPTLVVTRQQWVKANLALAKQLMPQASAKQGGVLAPVLGLLSGRVLGQYDPVGTRLLLNVQSIMAMERELGVDPDDFRLWVCLHEQTHRAQFAVAPWLFDEMSALALEAEQAELSNMSGDEIKDVIERATGLMSLLEGHADVMMDELGAAAVPSVVQLRKALEARRDRFSVVALLGKMIGLDQKMAQYREGAVFCRAVLAAGGPTLLNQAFAGPVDRPTLTEIRDPQAWIARHG